MRSQPQDPAQPVSRAEAGNFVQIHAALARIAADAVIAGYEASQFGTFKPALADLAVSKRAHISRAMTEYLPDRAEIDRTLAKGAERASEIAEPILAKTCEILGFVKGA